MVKRNEKSLPYILAAIEQLEKTVIPSLMTNSFLMRTVKKTRNSPLNNISGTKAP